MSETSAFAEFKAITAIPLQSMKIYSLDDYYRPSKCILPADCIYIKPRSDI